jgi:hypothetical protein
MALKRHLGHTFLKSREGQMRMLELLQRAYAATLIVLGCCSITPVEADVVYSNFGPGMGFDNIITHGWAINGSSGINTGNQAVAEQFTPAKNYIFGDAQVACG